jgi:Site-specific recombinase XerD
MPESYAKELQKKQVQKLRGLISELPPYVSQFMRGIEQTTQPRTRIGYAYDIKYFLEYLIENVDNFKGKSPKEITCADIDTLTVFDFENWLDYLSYYKRDGREYTNDLMSKKRKLCALRTFFTYLYKNELLKDNVIIKVNMPKIHEKPIIRMESNEVADFLDNVEFGTKISNRQAKFHAKEKTRDLALLSLMLSTGIRVSECVGLNLNDIDIENTMIKVTRKGGKEDTVYFSDEAAALISEYLEERKKIIPAEGHEDALFLSGQRKRLSVRSIEYIVKKYARVTTPLKHITPHKLRSTYGTALYQETGDIYLVANVLGHKDVNTTRKHYAEMDENSKRLNRNKVSLREDNIPKD